MNSAFRRLLPLVSFLLLAVSGYCQQTTPLNPSSPTSKPISHAPWDALLKKYVDGQGLVNYVGFRTDSVALNSYLHNISDNLPNERWSQNERLAYWLNAYNAFTIQRVIRSYPVKSIRNLGGDKNLVNTVWDQRFIRLGREKYSLNDIEQRIIRPQFQDARVHFALVCAAMSCPKLRREAYVGSRLQEQLDAQGREFMNDPTKNKLAPGKAELSSIFSFYPEDFQRGGTTIQQTVNRYASRKIKPDAQITYLPYNWALNEQKR
jgi:hypothetical protein